MSNNPFDNQANMLKNKTGAKYFVYVILGFLCCVLAGQVIMMMIPLSALNKVSGRITSIDTIIISYTHHKYSGSSPDYAPVIRLSTHQSFPIQEIDAQASLYGVLKKGDYVTIYYPTTTLRIVSATLARDISQIERGGQVLYSWKGQQTGSWYVLVMLAVSIAFFYWISWYIRNYVPPNKIK